MTKLSEAAEAALINVGTNRQGAVAKDAGTAALRELKDAGLISEALGGLTRKGAIERERIVARRLDEAFG